MKTVILGMLALTIAGCSSIQSTYKPLYQAVPEKEAIKVKKR
jgi:uncharacterized protein YceK